MKWSNTWRCVFRARAQQCPCASVPVFGYRKWPRLRLLNLGRRWGASCLRGLKENTHTYTKRRPLVVGSRRFGRNRGRAFPNSLTFFTLGSSRSTDFLSFFFDSSSFFFSFLFFFLYRAPTLLFYLLYSIYFFFRSGGGKRRRRRSTHKATHKHFLP